MGDSEVLPRPPRGVIPEARRVRPPSVAEEGLEVEPVVVKSDLTADRVDFREEEEEAAERVAAAKPVITMSKSMPIFGGRAGA